MGFFTKNQALPVSEKAAERGFYIPSGLALTEEQIKFVAETLKEILQ